jgi:cell division protein FtsB
VRIIGARGEAKAKVASLSVRWSGLVFFLNPRYNIEGTALAVILKRIFRRKAALLAGAAIGGYIWLAFWGPQGVQALIEKHQEIRQLQEQNATRKLENERRREHIRRLEDSRSEQEMEIRKQLKLLRPGETTFLLPDTPKDDTGATPVPDSIKQ